MKLKTIKVNFYKYNYKLDEPLSISFHTWYYRENIIVELEQNGVKGFGEAAPFEPITGDSQQDVIGDLTKLKEIKQDPNQIEVPDFYEYISDKVSSYTARAALDFAFHDLLGKLQKQPVFKIYRQTAKFVPNSVTVFIKDTDEETAQEAKRIYENYPHLQILKIKLKGTGDIERCRIIKDCSPENIKFLLDANQGFTDPVEAVKVISEIQKIMGEVVLVEEPCPRGELDKLKYVTDNIKGTMIFADESAATLEDAKSVVESRAAHGINIKLQKAGGIYQGKQIADMCKKAGLKVMVGSMLDGPIATAASTHFAVAMENVILSDLDMDLDMKFHVDGTPDFKDGERIPGKDNGLGTTLNFNAIDKLKSEGIIEFEQMG